jgi:hypothetical protein
MKDVLPYEQSRLFCQYCRLLNFTIRMFSRLGSGDALLGVKAAGTKCWLIYAAIERILC